MPSRKLKAHSQNNFFREVSAKGEIVAKQGELHKSEFHTNAGCESIAKETSIMENQSTRGLSNRSHILYRHLSAIWHENFFDHGGGFGQFMPVMPVMP